MPTDKERREAARKLRVDVENSMEIGYRCSNSEIELYICDILGLRCSECAHSWSGLEELADLIEPSCDLEARALPEGMEWPRYEDGELVCIGNEVHIENEKPYPNFDMLLESITISSSGFSLTGAEGEYVEFRAGERVKRPKAIAADGEPLEAGQTVYLVDSGKQLRVTCIGDMSADHQTVWGMVGNDIKESEWPASRLTHQRPVLDADGNRIEEGMDVWWICDGDERGIHAEKLHVDGIDVDGIVECSPCNGGTRVCLEPEELYVNRPVLDADGVPIREGDTVYVRFCDEPMTVSGFSAYGRVLMDFHNAGSLGYRPSSLTHAKTEPPDSWDRIEDDAKLAPGDYIEKHGRKTDLYAYEEMPIDLVRRCKALAEGTEK